MSVQVTKGLFSLDDFTDCHAILGVPVTADANSIRKRYLKIARKLHPDSFIGQEATEEAQVATQVFSKLVGPAYNTLSQEKERKEYLLLIQLKGKQAVQQMVAIDSLGATAQTLAAADDLDHAYTESVTALAHTQYEALSGCLEAIGQLSELNLVYLMRQASANKKLITSAPADPSPAPSTSSNTSTGSTSSSNTSTGTGTPAPGTPAASRTTSSLENYLRRADDYIAQKDFRSATMDLRDAMRIDPNDSRCHALMGKLYLAQGNLPMARVSVKRSLELDPTNATALKAKKELEKRGQVVDVGGPKGSASAGKASNAASSRKKDSKPDGGGFLGGLFGGKKK
ncbi:MAG: DnaJ domain-containing protein [Prochlorothrix sp.]|nr:DnaJ domain-containing protein [Prochlorothrix sp.]